MNLYGAGMCEGKENLWDFCGWGRTKDPGSGGIGGGQSHELAWEDIEIMIYHYELLDYISSFYYQGNISRNYSILGFIKKV